MQKENFPEWLLAKLALQDDVRRIG